jgi:Chaperone of endosialidase
MALDFPASPATGDKYPTSPAAGQPQYQWDGEKWVGVNTGYLPLAGGTLTGNLTVASTPNPTIAITASAANNYATLSLAKTGTGQAQINGYNGVPATATMRWNLCLGDGVAEGGGNSGSNFVLNNYTNAGAYIGPALTINRSNSAASFGGSVLAAGGAAPSPMTGGSLYSGAGYFIGGNKVMAMMANCNWDGANYRAISAGGAGIWQYNGNAAAVWNLYSNAGLGANAAFTPTVVFSVDQGGTGTFTGNIFALAGNVYSRGAGQPTFIHQDGSGNGKSQFYWQASSGQVGLFQTSTSALACLNGSGQWQTQYHYNTTAAAYMAGGTLWSNTSDARIKTVLGDYTLGLDAILKLNPVRYRYKANDTISEMLDQEPLSADPDPQAKPYVAKRFDAAPYPASQHYLVRDQTFVGFVAQEVEGVFPGLVTQRKGFIDGKPVDDLRDLNLNDMLFAMVNAIKTLAARVEELEARAA